MLVTTKTIHICKRMSPFNFCTKVLQLEKLLDMFKKLIQHFFVVFLVLRNWTFAFNSNYYIILHLLKSSRYSGVRLDKTRVFCA